MLSADDISNSTIKITSKLNYSEGAPVEVGITTKVKPVNGPYYCNKYSPDNSCFPFLSLSYEELSVEAKIKNDGWERVTSFPAPAYIDFWQPLFGFGDIDVETIKIRVLNTTTGEYLTRQLMLPASGDEGFDITNKIGIICGARSCWLGDGSE